MEFDIVSLALQLAAAAPLDALVLALRVGDAGAAPPADLREEGGERGRAGLARDEAGLAVALSAALQISSILSLSAITSLLTVSFKS